MPVRSSPQRTPLSAEFPVRPDLAQVAAARREVARIAGDWRVPLTEERFEDLTLLADEVIANAVRHTRARCTVTVRWTGTRIRVEVADTSPRRPRTRQSPPDAEAGRGLVLVDALATDWGTTDDPAGKVVWFEVGAHRRSCPPDMTNPTRRRVPMCGAETALPPELAVLALSFADPGSVQPEDAEVHLRCALQAHSGGEHHAFVLQLDGIDAGAVWTSWTEGPPTAVEVRADCEAVSPRERGSQPCCEFAGHPGAHTYDTYDRWALG